VKNTNSESSKLKLYIDDLPQIYEPPERGMTAVSSKQSKFNHPPIHQSINPVLSGLLSVFGELSAILEKPMK